VALAAIEADGIDYEPPTEALGAESDLWELKVEAVAKSPKGLRSRLLELRQPLGIPLRSSWGRDTIRYWQPLRDLRVLSGLPAPSTREPSN
jgi:hypothetical protein